MNGQTLVACPECIRFKEVEDEFEGNPLVEVHNESQHDEEEFAKVISATEEDLGEFFDHADEVCTPEQYEKLKKMFRGFGDKRPPFFVSAADWDSIKEESEVL